MSHPRTVSGPRTWRAVALTALILVLGYVGVRSFELPSVGNPFGTDTVDRSSPPLLTSLADLARFQAASGTYQVVVDQEDDVKRLPSVLAGERTLFLAQGSVDAFVDFSELDGENLVVSQDGTRVDIRLPKAALSPARVDPRGSKVISRDRGVLNRIGGVFDDDPTSERELYIRAGDQMSEAASNSGLQRKAQDNTTRMLKGLLAPLGYTDVRVTYEKELQP